MPAESLSIVSEQTESLIMGSDSIKMDDPMKKGKKKMWQICRCGCGWSIFGLVCLATGIALVVSFYEYWHKNEDWERGLAYLGVALICLGFLLVAAGIVFCAVLVIIWRRLTNEHGTFTMFHPPTYEYGKAPYPQQPPFNPDPNHDRAATVAGNANAPVPAAANSKADSKADSKPDAKVPGKW